MSGTAAPGRPGPGGGITDADRVTALRFVIGRSGWCVEARVSAEGEAHLGVTTVDPKTSAVRSWRVARTREGLVVSDGASGQRLRPAPTMQEALVEVWEATVGDAPD